MKLLKEYITKLVNETITEKWSKKYKASIDCNNPKGFSQRAHCQGKKKHLKENDGTQKVFLGYHSSKRNLKDGFYKGDALDEDDYSDLIRNAYMEIISDYDDNLENDDIEAMNDVFRKKNYGFTFVSKDIIKASSFQSTNYKYGNYLYKVYGRGNEILLDDPNEIDAEIVVSKNPLYFEQQD